MHFTLSTVSALLVAAVAVGASPMEARQNGGVPRVRATFYNNGGFCGPPQDWKEDTVFVQNAVGDCKNLDVGPFQATYFNESSVTRTCKSHSFHDHSDDTDVLIRRSAFLQRGLRSQVRLWHKPYRCHSRRGRDSRLQGSGYPLLRDELIATRTILENPSLR